MLFARNCFLIAHQTLCCPKKTPQQTHVTYFTWPALAFLNLLLLPLPLASAGSNVSMARGFSGCKEDVAGDVAGHLVAVASKPGSWLCH